MAIGEKPEDLELVGVDEIIPLQVKQPTLPNIPLPPAESCFKQLKGQQVLAFEAIKNFLNSTESMFLLEGYAGTGKTFLMKALAEEIEAKSWCFTAPTNKATKELKRNIGWLAPCKTIYSLLGIKMVSNEDQLVLEYPSIPLDISTFDVIVVDEASMANAELCLYIKGRASACNVKIIYVGDRAQLPPVGEKQSRAWRVKNKFTLTEVLRFDNQILRLATHIRDNVRHYPEVNLRLRADNDKHEGVWRLTREKFIRQIKRAANQGVFLKTDHTKAIAWRNRTVDELNWLIRNEIFKGEATTRWLVTDRVTVAEPVISPDDSHVILAHIDDEGSVQSVGVSHHTKFPELQAYRIVIKMDAGETITINAIHESSETRLMTELNNRAMLAKRDPRKWKDFWVMKEAFHKIRHSYAQTAHRSQGSTYRNTFVDTTDILANRDGFEALRCLYVACTRAKERVLLT